MDQNATVGAAAGDVPSGGAATGGARTGGAGSGGAAAGAMSAFERFRVYDSRDFVYVVGSRRAAREDGEGDGAHRLLRFEKALALGDFGACLYEDPSEYSDEALEALVARLVESSRRSGGLARVLDAVAIVGCVKFVRGYYLVVITNSVEEGEIDGHRVLSGRGSELVPLFNAGASPQKSSGWSLFSGAKDPDSTVEEDLKNLFRLVDLSKAYFWSYTYNLSQSLQRNTAAAVVSRARRHDSDFVEAPTDDRFVWNSFLGKPLLCALRGGMSLHDSPWLVALVHGSFKQQRCSIFSRSLTLTLIARRSRHFAGTRYLKRGVNDDGHVANDVEIEQIVQDHMQLANRTGTITSYVQMRGSIPTFWSQESSVASPKPPIKRNRFDAWYSATRKHFEGLISRYGESVFVLNLVKQTESRKRETIVGNDFKHAIELLNATLPDNYAIEYRAIDFTRLSKVDPPSLLRALNRTARHALDATSFFTTSVTAASMDEVGDAALELIRGAEQDARLLSFRRRRGLAAKVPLRWSIRKKAFMPMRMNTVFQSQEAARSPRSPPSGGHRPDTPPLPPLPEMFREDAADSPHALAAQSQADDAATDDDNDSAVTPTFGEWQPMAGANSPTIPRSLQKSASFASFTSETQQRALRLLNSDADADEDWGAWEDEEVHGYESDELDEARTPGCSDLLVSASLTYSPRASSWPSPSARRRSGGISGGSTSGSLSARHERIQKGVIRTNCIDCLDRTNLAQFLIGLHVLNEQLISIGVLGKKDRVGTDSKIATVLMEMYEEMGDRIALQYGGSDAHRKGGKLMSNASTSSRQQALYTSLQRYYSNAFTDHAKQDAINVFLGTYRPEHHRKNISDGGAAGETQTGDFYLHNRAVTEPPNFSLVPNPLQLGEWWAPPLAAYAKQVIIPLRAAMAVVAPEGGGGPPPAARTAVAGLTSFDALFSRRYFQPRDLALHEAGHAPPPNARSEDGLRAAPHGGLASRRSFFGTSSAASTGSPSRTNSPATPPRRKLRSWNSADSVASDASTESISVLSSIKSSLFGSRTHLTTAQIIEERQGFDDADTDTDPDTGLSAAPDAVPWSLEHDEDALHALDPAARDYLVQFRDPMSLYELPTVPGAEFEAWDRLEHEKLYKEALADYSIPADDGWGMRRLQAYSGSTHIIMYGPFKGYRRTHLVDKSYAPTETAAHA